MLYDKNGNDWLCSFQNEVHNVKLLTNNARLKTLDAWRPTKTYCVYM